MQGGEGGREFLFRKTTRGGMNNKVSAMKK